MSRKLVAFDRIIVLLIGALLIAAAVLSILWWADVFDSSESLQVTGIDDPEGQAWWPWAVGGAGILLGLLGLSWFIAHLKRQSLKMLRLKGSSPKGRLEVETSPVLDAAAEALENHIGVRSASGRMIKDRGQLIAEIDAKIEPSADLNYIKTACDDVAKQLNTMLQRDDIYCRVVLNAARHGRSLPRVS